MWWYGVYWLHEMHESVTVTVPDKSNVRGRRTIRALLRTTTRVTSALRTQNNFPKSCNNNNNYIVVHDYVTRHARRVTRHHA